MPITMQSLDTIYEGIQVLSTMVEEGEKSLYDAMQVKKFLEMDQEHRDFIIELFHISNYTNVKDSADAIKYAIQLLEKGDKAYEI